MRAVDPDEQRLLVSHRLHPETSPDGVLDQGHAALELSHGMAVVLFSHLEKQTHTHTIV